MRPGEEDADRVAASLERATEADVRIVPVRRPDAWWSKLEMPRALAEKLTVRKR